MEIIIEQTSNPPICIHKGHFDQQTKILFIYFKVGGIDRDCPADLEKIPDSLGTWPNSKILACKTRDFHAFQFRF